MKKFFTFAILLIVVFSAMSVVSAGLFGDFGADNSSPTANITELRCFVGGENEDMMIVDTEISSENGVSLFNKILYVNVTDENGDVESFNISMNENTSSFTDGDFECYQIHSLIGPFDDGTYEVTLYFPGDDEINANITNTTITFGQDGDDSDDVSDSSQSNEIVSVETYKEGDLTITNTTYADGHVRTTINGEVNK